MAEPLRAARWNLRIASGTDALVRQAASLRSQNMSEFVIGAALLEAERVLADRTVFQVDEAAWQEFLDLLDRPVRENAGLDRLFAGPFAFDE